MTDPRLLVPATPALLKGWCGPVVYDGEQTVTYDGLVFRDVYGNGGWWPVDGVLAVLLDISCAECRDRIVRVLGGALGMPTGIPLEFSADEDGWCLIAADLRGPECVGAMAVWDRAGHPAGCCHRPVPELADIDPLEATRLPDGSHLADALALAAIAREVLG